MTAERYRTYSAGRGRRPTRRGDRRSSPPPRARRRPPRRRKAGRGGLWLGLLLVASIVVGIAVVTGGGSGGTPPAPESATSEPPPVKVTFPEGIRREEMAAIVAEKTHLTEKAYLDATAPGPRGRRLAAADGPRSLEGFLFPATYDVGSRLTAKELVDSQVSAFAGYLDEVDLSFARSRNLTRYDVLIIASLIEREVRVPAERKIVAGVIYNRLKSRMRLDIDATVQYALGEWKTELTATDLKIDSPYNTRRYSGLPPGPIANPGLASLAAAARPANTDFLFYVARNDGTGRHYFASSPEEFEQAVARAAANGGG